MASIDRAFSKIPTVMLECAGWVNALGESGAWAVG